MRFLKKILVSSLVCVYALTGSAFATESENNEASTTMNEYSMIKELQNKTDLQLQRMGHEREEIEAIRNYQEDFKKTMDEIKLIDKSILKDDFGYTEEQIEIINNFDGSEEQMEKASANVTLSISKNSSSKSQTNSKLNVKVRFVWNGVPVFQFNDVFAMVNGEKMYYDNLNTLFTCTYNGSNGTQKTYQYYLKINEARNTGADVKFTVYKNEVVKYYVKSGSANVPLSRSAYVPECGIGVRYGHARISLSGIGVSYDGLSISISGNVDTKYTSSRFYL